MDRRLVMEMPGIDRQAIIDWYRRNSSGRTIAISTRRSGASAPSSEAMASVSLTRALIPCRRRARGVTD